jgi:branched-chain amino acid transport system permease protein
MTILVIGVATGFVYALVGVGYSLIYRTTGIVNFAQGAFVMVGGMSTYWLQQEQHVPYALAAVGGVLIAGAVGGVLWVAVVSPLWRRNSPAVVVILATLVFGDLVANTVAKSISADPQTLPPWFAGFRVPIGDASLDGQYVLVIAVALVAIIVVAALLQRSNIGRAMRACAANAQTSQLLGIAPRRVGAMAMIFTAMLAGLAGVVFTPAQYTDYVSALNYGIYGFVAATIGGFGDLWGSLVGGVLLGVVTSMTGRYISTNYELVIAFGILLVLLVLRPQGLLGRRATAVHA